MLKALALQASDPQAASASLARVAPGGPFEALRRAVQVCLMPGTGWLAGLRDLDEAGRMLVLDLKGCPKEQRRVVMELLARDADAPVAPLDLFNLVLRQRREIGEDVAQQVCRRLLVHAPQQIGAFAAAFQPLTPAQGERTLALAAEVKQRPDQAEDHWLEFIRLAGRAPAEARSAALVLRRLADSHLDHSADGALCGHAVQWLERSLQLDPTDQASHLRLIRDARKSGDLKLARSRIDAASRLLPDDAQLLQEAVETALASGAFKKAAGLAKQVLKLDPLNPRVRTLIGQAHVAHARKQIGTSNLEGARRELDEAATWFRDDEERALVLMLQGYAAGSDAAAEDLWRAALAALGGRLVGAFHLLLEGRRTRRDGAFGFVELPRRVGIDLSLPPGAPDLLALAQALNAQPARDRATGSVLDALASPLERAAKTVRLAENDDLLLCEALHRQGHTRLTQAFARAAQQRWPQRPVFVYLEVSVRFHANPWSMPDRDVERLERAFKLARTQGDERTASRLGRMLETAGGGFGPDFDLDPDDVPAGLDFMDGARMRTEMENFLLAQGEDYLLNLVRRQLGKADFEQLRRDLGGSSKKEFAHALVQLLVNNDFGPAHGAAAPRGRPLPKASR